MSSRATAFMPFSPPLLPRLIHRSPPPRTNESQLASVCEFPWTKRLDPPLLLLSRVCASCRAPPRTAHLWQHCAAPSLIDVQCEVFGQARNFPQSVCPCLPLVSPTRSKDTENVNHGQYSFGDGGVTLLDMASGRPTSQIQPYCGPQWCSGDVEGKADIGAPQTWANADNHAASLCRVRISRRRLEEASSRILTKHAAHSTVLGLSCISHSAQAAATDVALSFRATAFRAPPQLRLRSRVICRRGLALPSLGGATLADERRAACRRANANARERARPRLRRRTISNTRLPLFAPGTSSRSASRREALRNQASSSIVTGLSTSRSATIIQPREPPGPRGPIPTQPTRYPRCAQRYNTSRWRSSSSSSRKATATAAAWRRGGLLMASRSGLITHPSLSLGFHDQARDPVALCVLVPRLVLRDCGAERRASDTGHVRLWHVSSPCVVSRRAAVPLTQRHGRHVRGNLRDLHPTPSSRQCRQQRPGRVPPKRPPRRRRGALRRHRRRRRRRYHSRRAARYLVRVAKMRRQPRPCLARWAATTAERLASLICANASYGSSSIR